MADETSDGIIAPSYAPEALEILKAKKGGKYIVLQADANYEPPAEEQRVVYGTDMRQARAATRRAKAVIAKAVAEWQANELAGLESTRLFRAMAPSRSWLKGVRRNLMCDAAATARSRRR